MKRFMMFFAAATILLSGCAGEGPRVPKTTFPAKPYVETEQPEWTTIPPEPLPEIEEGESGSLLYIRERLEEDLGAEYPKIKIAAVRVPDCEAMPERDIAVGINPDYDLRDLAERLFSDRFDTENPELYSEILPGVPLLEERPELGSFEVYIKSFAPDENDPSMRAMLHSTGLLTGSETGAMANLEGYSGNFDTVAVFDTAFGEIPDDLTYKMSDGEDWNAREAAEFMEKFWREHVAPSDPEEFGYRVRRLSVLEIAEGKYGYSFEMEKTDKNGAYIEMSPHYPIDLAAIRDGKPFIFGCGLTAWCAEKEKITRFSKDWSFTEGEAGGGGELVTLSKAGEILSDALPEEYEREYTAELNYVAVCKGCPYEENGVGNISWSDSKTLANSEFTLKPYWVFKRVGINENDYQSYESFFIDAQTGELTPVVFGNIWPAGELGEGLLLGEGRMEEG